MVAALGKKRLRYCIEVQYWEAQEFVLFAGRDNLKGFERRAV